MRIGTTLRYPVIIPEVRVFVRGSKRKEFAAMIMFVRSLISFSDRTTKLYRRRSSTSVFVSVIMIPPSTFTFE